jgi:DNA-binding FrmR family transcriptional regulator
LASAARPAARVELVAHLQHLGDAAHALLDAIRRHAAVAQREGQVLRHGHRVVDHRKLEHLGDVALLRRARGHVDAVVPDAALRGLDEARHDVEQRGLAAARRAQQRVGAAVLERHLQRQQRVVVVRLRIGLVGVRQVEVDS